MQEGKPVSQDTKTTLDADLQAALADLLGLEWSEIEANSSSTFVELGGNSIKALELTFKLDEAGKSLDVETILGDDSSVQALSRALQHDSDDNTDYQATPSTESGLDVQPHPNLNYGFTPGSAHTKLNLFKEASSQLRCPESDIEDVLPLTSQQRGLWLGSLQVPGAYISRWQYRIDDDLDDERLLAAWTQTLKGNPILRTRILSLADSGLQQVILTNDHYESREDLLHQQDITVDEGAPLVSFNIDGRTKSKILNLTCHHVLYDRWSMKLILQDVQHAYQHDGTIAMRPSYLPILEPLSKATVENLLDTWREITQNETVVSAPIVEVLDGFPLASDVCELSMASCATESATHAELLAAAWSIVCSKHCGSPSVSFGLTVGGRDTPVPGITKMAFPTFNTIPFILHDLDSSTTSVVLAETKSRFNLIRRTQHLDIEHLASVNSVCRDSCRFNSILVVQQGGSAIKEKGLFDAEHLLAFETVQSAPLVLECTPTETEIMLKLKYDHNCISTVEADLMLHHLKAAFQQLSDNTDRDLKSLTLFTRRDLQYVKDWTGPSLPLKRMTLHSMIENSARDRPDSLALWQTDRSLTYRALIDRSRGLMAKILAIEGGLSPNIGVCFEKSAYAIVAMLGISMAGHVFVLMDASNPSNRLIGLAESAEMDLIVCSPSMVSTFADEDLRVIILDDKTATSTLEDGKAASSNPDSTVYMIYTSGSTGEPKGVTMTHQALCTTVKAISSHLEFDSETRTLQFASFAFDMSVHDIWCTLLTGGTVCIPTDAERFELEEFISRSGCNYAMLTPSVALTLSEQSWRSFKKFCSAGETLVKPVVQSALQAGVKLWNAYGPTEACVICLTDLVKAKDINPSKLGHSMAATTWIVDADDPHRLAPVGCLGELVLSGHTLSTGYYRDPQKTSQAFMTGLEWTKQFPDHPLDRVYRTGDLARYQSDGSIEFHGRMGGYTKIAGNRVDLGEIEHALYSKCNLPQASVQYCTIGSNEIREVLVSFCAFPSKSSDSTPVLLSMEEGMEQQATEGFRKLKEILPNYMIPAAFIPVNKFPYSISSKLDQKRLVSMIADQNVDDLLDKYGIDTQTNDSGQHDSDGEALSSEAAIMRDLWAAVLKIDPGKISGHSNFFKLGGDSLTAMNLGANLRQSGRSIAASDIFKYPVLVDMANQMKSTSLRSKEFASKDVWSPEAEEKVFTAAADVLHLSRRQIESVLPCTPLQVQMLAASTQSPSTYLHRECFELASTVTDSEIRMVCQNLMDSNELLRSKACIDQQTGQFVLVILQPHVLNASSHEDGDLQHYLESDHEPLGMERDLSRFILLSDGQSRVLVWEMHHSIFDGYSNALLRNQIRDVVMKVRQSGASDDSKSFERPGFKGFVQYLKHADQQEAQNFWSKYLHDAPEPVLPFVKQESGSRATNAKISHIVECKLPSQSKFTPAIYIRAAFALTLSQYASNTDVVFAATNHGRDLPVQGIERLVAPTFSTLPVRCIVNRDETIGTLLSRLQIEAAEIASSQHISTEVISSINTECKQACQFLMHLLVQPTADETVFEELRHLGYRAITDVSPMNLQIPFNLVATVKGNTMCFDMIYNNKVFFNRQIQLLFDQFSSSLISLSTSDEDVPVGDICGLGELNRQTYLAVQPGKSRQDKFAGMTLPQLVFNHRLEAHDGDPALYSTGVTFTYGQMFELASALAGEIHEHIGTLDHQYVPLCFEKSPSAIIAQLAVLMTGNAYVSVDASWPIARKEAILRQLNSKVIIASTHMTSMLEDVGIQIMTFDSDTIRHQATQSRRILSKARAEDAAYVIFTSGTTGVPKGVVVQHDTICRTVSTYVERLSFTRSTRSVLFASFSFDASVMETWSVLAAGGTLCIADDNERISDMDSFLIKSKADVIGLTPTSAMLLDPSRHDHVKTLLFCGEKCQNRDLERWIRPDLRLVNAYGPSETSVNAVMNTHFSSADLDNIGESMGGGLWVVNPNNHNEMIPVGCVGELLVTGPVLAKGYLNDDQNTAQKFVYPEWDDWTDTAGVRAYKTGDLVRLDADGSLHFIGRQDGQMKVNGIRIESNEIESAVAQSDVSVGETVVGAFDAGDEKYELAIFFVPSEKIQTSDVQILPLDKAHHQTILQLHQHLTNVLPRSHVPNLYVPISAVPSSTSGKTDRKALCQALAQLHPVQINLFRPEDELNLASQNETAPASSDAAMRDLSETETTLVALWTKVLHRGTSQTSIGPKSHFIRSGGDSISAIRLSSAARSKDIDLPVSLIYVNPVLADMAAAMDSQIPPDDGFDDLVSPLPFELIQGMDLSPDSPLWTRDSVKSRDDYFGPMNV